MKYFQCQSYLIYYLILPINILMTLSLANLQGSRQPTITSQPQPILIISKLQMVTKCLLHGALQRYYSRLPQRPQVWLLNLYHYFNHFVFPSLHALLQFLRLTFMTLQCFISHSQHQRLPHHSSTDRTYPKCGHALA